MVQDLSSLRVPVTAARARLDAFMAQRLGVELALLQRPGTSIITAVERQLTDWHGLIEPLFGVTPGTTDRAVLSCHPALVRSIERALGKLPEATPPFDPAWLAAVATVALTLPAVRWSISQVYATDAAGFQSHHVDPSVKIERWAAGTSPTARLAEEFDGPCFVVRDGAGQIVSRAGIRCWSELAWEVAAVTEPAYRGRGLATSLTARATAEVLEAGRLAVWLTDPADQPAQRLVERMGFELYGSQLSAVSQPLPPAS